MVVIILREGDLLNSLPFSIIGCSFYAISLYAANVIRPVIKAHQQDKYGKANCPNADVDLKMGCVDSVIQLLRRLENRNSVSSAGVGGVQECAPLQRTALC